MWAIITILIVGVAAAIIMMLAAALLASQIGSTESEYAIEEDLVKPYDTESSTIEASP